MSKFTINTKLLARELGFVTSTINPKAPNLNWQHVLLEAENEHVTISATDGNSAATTTVILNKPITEPVSIAIPGVKLLEIVRLIDEELITFSEAETKITVVAGKGRYGFGKNPAAASHIKPMITLGVVGSTFKMGTKPFIEALKLATVFAAKEDSTKYTLAGVLVEAKDNGLYSRATDGHRAMDFTVNDPMPGRDESIFIHSDYVPLITTIVDCDEKIAVTKGETTIMMVSGKRTAIVRRMLNENLPSIASVVDKVMATNQITAESHSKHLASAVKRMQTASDGKYRKVIVTVKTSGLQLSAADSIAGAREFEEELTATTNGEGYCSLNAVYVLELLKFVGDDVKFHITGDEKGHVLATTSNGLRCLISQCI